MQNSSEKVYCNSLVAVFHAAFQLGFDPYALAVQAKFNVAIYLDISPLMLAEGPERIIDESLIVARLINKNWPHQ